MKLYLSELIFDIVITFSTTVFREKLISYKSIFRFSYFLNKYAER